MLRLFFAVVGVAGMAFHVNVDENETITHLSNAIMEAKKNGFKKIDANELLLYRATKGDEWLVSDSPDAVAMRDGVIPDAIQQMTRIALDPAEIIGDIFGKAPKKKTIHVLVKLLDTTTLRVNLPSTSTVNLNSCEDLLAFLESKMIEKDVISANPSTLIEDILQFRLVGREKVVGEISNCFHSAIEGVKTKGLGPNKLEIPVCSGMSGLGKTRMLEESKRILCEEMKLDPRYVVSVIVPYSHNGYRPVSVEESMPIQASFSWRLLYQFFLMNNCSVAFSPWVESRLPRNGNQLTLKNAVEAIELKVRSMRELNGGKLYLFLGIDGYQKIKTVRPNQPNSLLHELMEVIGEFVSVGPSVTLLPMFAGTELLAAGANKSIVHYQTRQLPMTLLTMDQVFQLVDSREYYSGFLTHPEFLRNLFFLGGVPQWIVDYLTDLRFEWLLPGKAVPLTVIKDCYEATKAGYVMEYLRLLDPPGLVRLAAYAVSGTAIKENSPFDGKFKWSDLQESSVCLLLPRMHEDGYDVRVPYPLLVWTGEEACTGTSVENDFVDALGELYDRVDSVLFNVQPWQLWEEFGACFYAARINAFLLLGRSTVTLGELLPGAKMTARTSRISVNLISSRVFQATRRNISSNWIFYHSFSKVAGPVWCEGS